jgi:c-di-AMP phosphodiesterase-like protein
MSPYGVDKDLGGDNEENVSWMENCVRKVMKQGKDKSSAVAICKATLKRSKNNKAKASFIIDKKLYELLR